MYLFFQKRNGRRGFLRVALFSEKQFSGMACLPSSTFEGWDLTFFIYRTAKNDATPNLKQVCNRPRPPLPPVPVPPENKTPVRC